MALPTFGCPTPLLWHGYCSPPAAGRAAAIGRYLRQALSSKPATTACGGRMGQTDRQTDGRQTVT